MHFPSNLSDLVVESINEFCADTPGLDQYKFASHNGLSGQTATVSYAAVIGFAGDLIKGSCVVTGSAEMLRTSHPNLAMGMPVQDADLSDWIGEIVNQLLGRIKNKMVSYGANFSMATPTVVAGKQMAVGAPKDGCAQEFHYAGPHGPMTLLFLAQISPDIDFNAPRVKETMSEGNSLLF